MSEDGSLLQKSVSDRAAECVKALCDCLKLILSCLRRGRVGKCDSYMVTKTIHTAEDYDEIAESLLIKDEHLISLEGTLRQCLPSAIAGEGTARNELVGYILGMVDMFYYVYVEADEPKRIGRLIEEIVEVNSITPPIINFFAYVSKTGLNHVIMLESDFSRLKEIVDDYNQQHEYPAPQLPIP